MRYQAFVSKEGGNLLAEFPDCPGCQTFAGRGRRIEDRALAALVGWLEANLVRDLVPPAPKVHRRAPRGARLLSVVVPIKLAVKIVLKRSRLEVGLTQAALARRAGVTQARIAQLESPDHGLKLDTLERVAGALGLELEIAARRTDAA